MAGSSPAMTSLFLINSVGEPHAIPGSLAFASSLLVPRMLRSV